MSPANRLSNITPAHRVSEVKEYYFSMKLKEIARMNKAGMQVINLGIGSPDMPPHPHTIETLCSEAHLPTTHGYQPYVGIAELREAFASWYKRWYDVTLDPTTEIQPLIGSKEGILHISLAFLNEGDSVLIPNPGYPTYSSVSQLVGANIIPYELSEANNWMPDFEALEQTDLSNVKLMWVNYPHMPTGTAATTELYTQLVAFGKRHNIVIVNDNPYSFILNDNPQSILHVEGAKDICIEMNSMSKSHNMAGWRIGMLASNPQFVTWVLRVKSNVDSGMFRPLQKAAVEALSCNEDWHKQMNTLYRQRRVLAEELATLLGCSFDPAQVGLFLWIKIPDSYNNGIELADKILDKAHVFITPGSVFGSCGEKYIRISLCATEEVIQKAIDRIKKVI